MRRSGGCAGTSYAGNGQAAYENQMCIRDSLCKGKTVLIVAHRLGAIKMCDKVAVVENHTITAFGTHEEVLEENRYYQKAWERYHAAREVSLSLIHI